ncbi:MAG: S10 family peptidase [Acidobacteriota bacterium]
MKKVVGLMLVLLSTGWGPALRAQEPPSKTPASETKTPASPPPQAEQSVTEHSITVEGKPLEYTATAGTLILRNEKDEPVASMGYVAYAKKGVEDFNRRPVTFAYNGGPGSSSIWLHMGALGPRRVAARDVEPTPPPPYKLVDNPHTLLDRSDLVLIDPVGTGLSRAVGKAKDKDFWGVDPDIESVSRFIAQYVSKNNRWNSPKYLLGESYGTMRSAGVVNYLQTREGMAFNGVILVSVFVDARTVVFVPGNDLAHILFLPTYAAVAWFHNVVPNRPESLEAFLEDVRAFAAGDYADALMKGDRLDESERTAVVKRLSAYTGLDADYLDKANLRVTEGQFTKELLRRHHLTVGRLDSRFTGVSFNLLGEEASYDPQSASISPAYTAAFLHYYHNELRFGRGKTYTVSNRKLFTHWEFKHQAPGTRFPISSLPNTGPDLARAMGYNPGLQVLVLNGYFDLATPFFATEYTMDHLGLEESLRSNIHMKYYPAGHMMYLQESSLAQMKKDVSHFIEATLHP